MQQVSPGAYPKWRGHLESWVKSVKNACYLPVSPERTMLQSARPRPGWYQRGAGRCAMEITPTPEQHQRLLGMSPKYLTANAKNRPPTCPPTKQAHQSCPLMESTQTQHHKMKKAAGVGPQGRAAESWPSLYLKMNISTACWKASILVGEADCSNEGVGWVETRF